MSNFYINNENAENTNALPLESFMNYEEDTYDVFGSVFLREMNQIQEAGEFKVREFSCRFDNIAYETLQNSDYWWFMMEYNNYIDWDVKSSHVLKIPNMNDIIVLRSSLIVRQNELNRKK